MEKISLSYESDLLKYSMKLSMLKQLKSQLTDKEYQELMVGLRSQKPSMK